LLFEEPLPPHLQAAWLSPLLQPQAVHPWSGLVTDGMVAWAKAQGLAVNVWTVNEAAEAHRLAALGVDVIMSDVPDQLIQEIR
jgi:glycerophosphoryl diester phosphodiesterase